MATRRSQGKGERRSLPRICMKRTALLSFDWDYEVMAAYYHGMAARVAEDADVQLVIFNSYGHTASYEAEQGAFEVFKLCDLERFDGFIVQGNRVWAPAMRQQLADEICAMGKPLVSINYALGGSCCVGTDNYKAMYGLVARVLADQGCVKPAFINGFAGSKEAMARAQGYRDACRDQGIADARFYQANWQLEEGIKVAQQLLETPDDLPDVIFCCNDDLAVGVQQTLQKAGVRVPQDVMISGFDNRENSQRAVPRITTVDRDFEGAGYVAMDALLSLLDGAERKSFVGSDVKYLLSASCGYDQGSQFIDDVATNLYSMDHALKLFYELLVRFQPTVLDANTLTELLCSCEAYLPEVRCPQLCLSLSEDYLTYELSSIDMPYGPRSALMAYVGPDALTHDERHVYATFPTFDLVPSALPMGPGTYMVFSLHDHATCIGTLVTEGISPIYKYGFLNFILTLLSSSFEIVRKKMLLQEVNDQLDELYVHDHLTGLFNRFGLARYGMLAYDHILRDFDQAHLIFVDVDGMKQINDNCGHEMGDQALLDVTKVINRAAEGENAFAMRYGGDEFLLICRRNLISKLERELERLNGSVQRPYVLSLSMGCVRVQASEQLGVKEAVALADARMYEMKRERKANGS